MNDSKKLVPLAEERVKRVGGKQLIFECAADIPQTSVDWLWEQRIARGKMTLFAGNPALGKSQITLDAIARMSRGAEWPDGGVAPLGSALIISAEDRASDTICPRLELAKAELRKVHILREVTGDSKSQTLNLQTDLQLLENAVKAHGDVLSITIDPITAYLGDVDSHRTTDVRAVLEPFDRFAAKFQVAILAITHPPKAAQKAIHSFTGSMAFVAAARLAFFCAEETAGAERRLFLPVKNNLGPLAPGLGYTTKGGVTSAGIKTSSILWDGKPVRLTADEVMCEVEIKDSAIRKAEHFLEDSLKRGQVLQTEIESRAKAENVAIITLRRAKKNLGVKSVKSKEDSLWYWQLGEGDHFEDDHA